MRVVSNPLLTGDVPILEREEEEEKQDLELDNAVAQLGISEYQANRLFHFLAGRLDRSNPVAFFERVFHTRLRAWKQRVQNHHRRGHV